MTRLNPDGSQTTLIQDRLAWVILYRRAMLPAGSGGPPRGPGQPGGTTGPAPCHLGTVLIPVDANNGQVFFVHAVGDGPGQ